MSADALRLIDGGGPRGREALWAKDEWHQRELPHGDLPTTYDREVVLRFGGLEQQWLKEAAKRWARARLLASLSPRSLERYLRELMEFSRWLAERDVASPGEITRALLEDYMLYVRTRPWAQATRRRLGALRALLDEQRYDGLAGLPRSAVIHFAEMPRVTLRPPKGLDKHVFDQLIDPGSLRLVELLARDERSVNRILQGLEIDADQHERDPAAAPLDLIQLARAPQQRDGEEGS